MTMCFFGLKSFGSLQGFDACVELVSVLKIYFSKDSKAVHVRNWFMRFSETVLKGFVHVVMMVVEEKRILKSHTTH